MKVIGVIMVGLLAVFGAMQLVPYGRAHTNPPTRQEPPWDSDQTRALAVRACFDCHSNQTRWPWYSNVAPVSWLVQRDVDDGRRTLNYSEWGQPQKKAAESAESLAKGEMPPWFYTMIQSHARLGAREREALVQGFAATFGRKKERD